MAKISSQSLWYVVNFNQIRLDLSISDASKRLGKKSLSGEALENHPEKLTRK